MTLTKADLVKIVKESVHLKRQVKGRQQYLFPELNCDLLSNKQANDLVEKTLELIKKSLEKGDNVLISGFGKFQVKFKWARKGRNPKTGEDLILDSRRIVAFHSSSKLKNKINKNTAQVTAHGIR